MNLHIFVKPDDLYDQSLFIRIVSNLEWQHFATEILNE